MKYLLSKICVWDADCIWTPNRLTINTNLSKGDLEEIQRILIIDRSISKSTIDNCKFITHHLLDYPADYYISDKGRFYNEIPVILEMLKNIPDNNCEIVSISEYHDLRDAGVIY